MSSGSSRGRHIANPDSFGTVVLAHSRRGGESKGTRGENTKALVPLGQRHDQTRSGTFGGAKDRGGFQWSGFHSEQTPGGGFKATGAKFGAFHDEKSGMRGAGFQFAQMEHGPEGSHARGMRFQAFEDKKGGRSGFGFEYKEAHSGAGDRGGFKIDVSQTKQGDRSLSAMHFATEGGKGGLKFSLFQESHGGENANDGTGFRMELGGKRGLKLSLFRGEHGGGSGKFAMSFSSQQAGGGKGGSSFSFSQHGGGKPGIEISSSRGGKGGSGFSFSQHGSGKSGIEISSSRGGKSGNSFSFSHQGGKGGIGLSFSQQGGNRKIGINMNLGSGSKTGKGISMSLGGKGMKINIGGGAKK